LGIWQGESGKGKKGERKEEKENKYKYKIVIWKT
jgi:hypothetical protein